MTVDGYSVYRNTRDQFLQDKLFVQDDECALILEGVILNRKELLERSGESSFPAAVKKMFLADRGGFFTAFRGMFSGAAYDKAAGRWTVFADQIGNRAVFYYVRDGHVIVGSQLNYVTDTMRANGIARRANENGIRQFLRYGCFMDDSTNIEHVRRILPGDCLTIEGGAARLSTYCHFAEALSSELSDSEAIDRMDAAFRNAVGRALEKNAEYGYTGVLDLSGGADSRMIAFTAHALGQGDTIACHYSQTGSNEIRIAQQIASGLDLEFYYHALDDARFLQDAETIIGMNSGTAYYCGITGGKRMLEALGGKRLGIEFTGLLGDVYEGAMISKDGDAPPSLRSDRYAFDRSIPPESLSLNTLSRFETNNLFWLFARGMLCGMSTFFTRQNYVEPFTPFGDVEFLQVYLSIPWKRRIDRLLLRWLQSRYPEAMAYPYASTGMPLSLALHPRLTLFMNKLGAVRNITAQKLGRPARASMNPIDRWEAEKPWLRPWLDDRFREGLGAVEAAGLISAPLLEHMKQLYADNTVMNKYVVLSIFEYFRLFML